MKDRRIILRFLCHPILVHNLSVRGDSSHVRYFNMFRTAYWFTRHLAAGDEFTRSSFVGSLGTRTSRSSTKTVRQTPRTAKQRTTPGCPQRLFCKLLTAGLSITRCNINKVWHGGLGSAARHDVELGLISLVHLPDPKFSDAISAAADRNLSRPPPSCSSGDPCFKLPDCTAFHQRARHRHKALWALTIQLLLYLNHQALNSNRG
jgi:hypothetical protein